MEKKRPTNLTNIARLRILLSKDLEWGNWFIKHQQLILRSGGKKEKMG